MSTALECQFSRLAETDLEAIAFFIAADSPRRALSFVGELRLHCLLVAKQPLAYPLREEYGAGIRMTVHGRYLIFHAIRDDAVVIERIIHGARHPESMLQPPDKP
ncbi:MAG: type II toxin-antitoxin system RelE/ParE family toxin [Bosea sp. (in: a-proteobacteria)]